MSETLNSIIKKAFQSTWEDKYGVERIDIDKFEFQGNGKLKNFDMQIAYEFFNKGFRAGRGDDR